jgi:hypothetical protein
MDPEGVERKLAAILSADVVGYARLMAEDEDETVRRLGAYRTPNAYVGAHLYARAADAEAMYRCLNEEVAVFGDFHLGLKVEPVWDPYRDDPRFTALLQRMNLAD